MQGRILEPVHDIEASDFPDPRGIWGQEATKRDDGIATPTDRWILAPQLRILGRGARSDNSWSRRGEAERKGANEDRCNGDGTTSVIARSHRGDLTLRFTPGANAMSW